MKIFNGSPQLRGKQQSLTVLALFLELQPHLIEQNTTLVLHFEGALPEIVLVLDLFVEPAVRVEKLGISVANFGISCSADPTYVINNGGSCLPFD
jgi:hypothetical protein